MLARMIQAHDQILASLEQVNHDIESKINDLAQIHKDLFESDREISVVIALSHQPLTLAELEQATDLPRSRLAEIVKQFLQRGIAVKDKDRYLLGGINAE